VPRHTFFLHSECFRATQQVQRLCRFRTQTRLTRERPSKRPLSKGFKVEGADALATVGRIEGDDLGKGVDLEGRLGRSEGGTRGALGRQEGNEGSACVLDRKHALSQKP
jgi:hypothetical protein